MTTLKSKESHPNSGNGTIREAHECNINKSKYVIANFELETATRTRRTWSTHARGCLKHVFSLPKSRTSVFLQDVELKSGHCRR